MVKGQPLVSLNIAHPAAKAGVSKMWACACLRGIGGHSARCRAHGIGRPLAFFSHGEPALSTVWDATHGAVRLEMLSKPPIVAIPIACVAPPAIWGRRGNATSGSPHSSTKDARKPWLRSTRGRAPSDAGVRGRGQPVRRNPPRGRCRRGPSRSASALRDRRRASPFVWGALARYYSSRRQIS